VKTKFKKTTIVTLSLCAFFGVVSAGVLHASSEYKLPPVTTPTPLPGSDVVFLKSFSKVFSNISKSASPALVLIIAEKKVTVPQNDLGDDFFFPFLPPQFRGQGRQKQGVETDAGSGFFVDLKNGYVITNNHVIDSADKITVSTYENKKFKAKLIGTAKNLDIAVLKLEDFKSYGQLQQLSLADSDKVEVGDWVVALGAPFDLPQTVTMGVVSALKRSSDTLGINGPNSFIQTDAAVNPGNSGGPLVDLNGQVIGMNTAIYSKSGGSVGIGFAIPSNTIRLVADSLINNGKVSQAYLGIEMYDLSKFSPQALKEMNVDPNTEGGLVMRVVPNSPAAKAGLQPYDIIQSIDDKAVKSPSDIQAQVMFLKPGTAAKIGVQRNKKHMDLSAVVTEFPKQENQISNRDKEDRKKSSQKWVSKYGLVLESNKKHVVISDMQRGSVADMAGLQKRDVILQVNRVAVNSVEDVEKVLEKSQTNNSNSIFLLMERDGDRFAVVLQN
jgi:serine protease Do